MKVREFTDGFQIAEVVVFLALSAMTITIAVSALSGSIKQAQYRDSVEQTASYIERKIGQISDGSLERTGINCRWVGGGGNPYNFDTLNGSCSFLGYMFEFSDPDDITATDPSNKEIFVYQMYGRRMNTSDINACSDDILVCARPVRVPDAPVSTVSTFTIPWTLTITNIEDSTPTDIKGVGYFRQPDGNGIIPVAIKDTGATFTDIINTSNIYDLASDESLIGPEFNIKLCLADEENRRASILLGEDTRESAVETRFDDTTC